MAELFPKAPEMRLKGCGLGMDNCGKFQEFPGLV